MQQQVTTTARLMSTRATNSWNTKNCFLLCQQREWLIHLQLVNGNSEWHFWEFIKLQYYCIVEADVIPVGSWILSTISKRMRTNHQSKSINSRSLDTMYQHGKMLLHPEYIYLEFGLDYLGIRAEFILLWPKPNASINQHIHCASCIKEKKLFRNTQWAESADIKFARNLICQIKCTETFKSQCTQSVATLSISKLFESVKNLFSDFVCVYICRFVESMQHPMPVQLVFHLRLWRTHEDVRGGKAVSEMNIK